MSECLSTSVTRARVIKSAGMLGCVRFVIVFHTTSDDVSISIADILRLLLFTPIPSSTMKTMGPLP